VKTLALLGILFSANSARAFPEMARHGYTQCTACHVSPTGGGLLTAYGRELAGELLSTWSAKNESQFLHSEIGAKLAEKGWLFGGDVRELQYRYKDKNQLTGKLFLMHADFQVAYQTEHFTGVMSIGQIEDPTSGDFTGNFYSTMYYGFIHFTDELGLRAGRFDPAFGLNLPDHTVVTKAGLGFAPTLQFDTLEANYLSEHWTILATAARTVDNTIDSEQETVRTVNVSYSFLNRMRIGASYWEGQGTQLNRHIYGVNAILGFTDKFYNLTEVDFENQSTDDGAYVMSQLAYEIYKGIIPYVQYQRQHTDLTNMATLTDMYGAGFHWFPRPHFELSGEWDHLQMASQGAESAWMMGHYYF
jgi:hypothetical protein